MKKIEIYDKLYKNGRTKEEHKLNKKNNGITMVALVVTIIVLLILTGVTVHQLSSDEGVVDKSINETEYHQEAIQNEQSKMNEVMEKQMQDWGF